MNIEEIKPGMKFKENDTRFTRYVVVTDVDVQNSVIVLNGKTKSRRPERFHKDKKSFGYSLVVEGDVLPNGQAGQYQS
jgi:vacuolar-type H+-ATPase subunit C/Vma6